MSIKITHECDRCGHTVTLPHREVLSRWGTLKQAGGASSGNEKAPPVDWLLCPECVDECATTVAREPALH